MYVNFIYIFYGCTINYWYINKFKAKTFEYVSIDLYGIGNRDININ